MIRNSSESWGWPARAFHWIVAATVLGLFVQGEWMEDLARSDRTYQIWLHCAVGASLIAIAGAGFLWWLFNDVPKPPSDTPAWQETAARLVHWLLYALIFVALISGWLLTGTMRGGIDVQMFGVVTLPALLAPGSGFHEVLEEAHELSVNALIALVAMHVMAALYHHFVLRDAVLWRMLGPKPKKS